MANSPPDADAAFFNLMHSYLTTPPKGEGGDGSERGHWERRDGSRRTFRLRQRIAPGFCWEVPPETAWIDVLCCDLTQGGFSYFLDEKPGYERLVVMFRPSDPIYVAARVNHCRPVLVDEWGGVLDRAAGVARAVPECHALESKFLVGCQFLRRFSSV